MSPNDLKAMRICAKLMGVPQDGYNPIENDEQAKSLAEKLGLKTKIHTSPSIGTSATFAVFDVYKNGKLVGKYSNFTENKAIVYGACASQDKDWYSKPRKRTAE